MPHSHKLEPIPGTHVRAINKCTMEDGRHTLKVGKVYTIMEDSLSNPYVIDEENEAHYFKNDWADYFLPAYEPVSAGVPDIEPAEVTKLSGGGGFNYYDLPPEPEQLQDLIEYRNMNGNLKDIFKACYRMGLKEGTSDIYDAEKIVFYALRELGRLLGRKDYLTISKEIIGHQAKEK